MQEFLIDYLAFTVKYDTKFTGKLDSSLISHYVKGDSVESAIYRDCADILIKDVLGVAPVLSENFTLFNRGLYGYLERYSMDGIFHICFNGSTEGMGAHCVMTGEGCRWFESQPFFPGWKEFFTRLLSFPGKGIAVNVTRFDIAKDDYDGILNLDEIEELLKQGQVVSKSRNVLPVCEYNPFKRTKNGVEHTGKTLYIGKRASNTYIRFYDKLAQMKSKYKSYDENMLANCSKSLQKDIKRIKELSHWVRFEVEFKDLMAMKIVRSIVDKINFSAYFAKCINGFFRFVYRSFSEAENVTRCKVREFWTEFIGTIERSKLSVGKYISRSVETVKCYVSNYQASILEVLRRTIGERELLKIIRMGAKLNDNHYKLIDDYEKENMPDIPSEMSNLDVWNMLADDDCKLVPVSSFLHGELAFKGCI